MLKQLKWNYLNFFKNYAWLYIAYGAVLVAWVIAPALPGYLPMSIRGPVRILGLFFYGYSFVLSLQVMVGWLGRRTAPLELSVPIAPWRRLLSKLIVAVSINVTALPLAYLLNAKGWKDATLTGFLQGLQSLAVYVLFLLLFLSVVTLSYLLVGSQAWARRHIKLLTALVTCALFLLLGLLSIAFFAVSGVWHFKIDNYVEMYVLPRPGLTWLASIFSVAGPLGMTAAIFAGSAALLARRFEQN